MSAVIGWTVLPDDKAAATASLDNAINELEMWAEVIEKRTGKWPATTHRAIHDLYELKRRLS